MNSVRVRIVLCCVPAIFANGCNPIDPCAEVTCDPNEVCVNGTCETVCDGDDDCAAGETCFNAVCAANCVVNDSCACDGDADCNDQNACTTDTCAGEVGCINTLIPFPCNTAADCPDGCNVACNGGFCSNSVDPDPCAICEPNEFCIFGPLGAACVECVNDAECDAGEVCDSVNGNCVECVSDGHCDGGDVCDEATNTCVVCVGAEDCDDQSACTNDFCLDQSCSNRFIACNSAFDCPAVCNAACTPTPNGLFRFCSN